MGDFDTQEHQPDIEIEIEETEPPGKLKPLPAAIIRLGPGQDAGGTANEVHLRELINIGRRDSIRAGWSAADYNNLACAYYWLNRDKGIPKAIGYLEEAQGHSPSKEEKETIEHNLKLLKVSSRGG